MAREVEGQSPLTARQRGERLDVGRPAQSIQLEPNGYGGEEWSRKVSCGYGMVKKSNSCAITCMAAVVSIMFRIPSKLAPS